MGLVLAIGYTLLFGFQIYLHKLPKDKFNGAVFLNLIGPIISVGLNCFKDQPSDKNVLAIAQ